MNRRLRRDKRSFLLIGPGRWGSADSFLGIPVQWADISGVAAVIEVRNNKIKAEPSQGTHFFQNITSLGIPYLTLNEGGGRVAGRRADFLDWNWLIRQPDRDEKKYVCHVHLEKPFILKCDGIRSESVLVFPDK